MIFNCQRKSLNPVDTDLWHVHRVEAPDEATARIMMFNRGLSWSWLDPDKTNVWSAEEWTAT